MLWFISWEVDVYSFVVYYYGVGFLNYVVSRLVVSVAQNCSVNASP